TDDAEAYERFLREARVVARLTHPNIVTCHDFGVDDAGRSYLVMELVRGRSLRQRLAQGPVPWPEALRIARDIAKALRTAHAEGVVHRDLKPENVMLVDESGAEMRAKVLDFGLAKLRQGSEGVVNPSLGAVGPALTEEGIFLGTPGYVAPEFAVDGISDDPRSDLYALGVILFELLTGQAPFHGQTALSVVMAHVQRPAPSPGATAPRHGIPPPVDALVLSLLEKTPAKRPADADTLVMALDELLQDPRAAHVSALPADVATEASAELHAELRRALPSTEPPVPISSAAPPPDTTTPSTAASFPKVPAATGASVPSRPRSHAGRLVAVLLVVVGLGLWSARTPDLSRACRGGDGEACLALGQLLEGGASPDLVGAQEAYEASCESGQRSGCERLKRPWQGGVWREGFLGERGAITPYERRDTIGRRIARQVFERLVDKDDEGRLTPSALRRWELSPDGRRLTLQLREGARFQPHPRCFPEGRPATTEDLAAAVEHAARRWPYFDLPLAKGSVAESGGGEPSGIVVKGDVVTLLLKSPVVDAAQALAEVWLLPRHEGDCDNPDDLRHPAGTGTFRFVEAQRDGRTVLTRDEHAAHASYLDGVEFLPVGDLEEALARMPERLDLVRFDPRTTPVRWEDEEGLRLVRTPAGVSAGQVVLTGLLDLTLLELNARSAPELLDVEVRRAI
ncbi:MAG: protein kinase domain-containing protein, partial [Myxococcota bacterium]